MKFYVTALLIFFFSKPMPAFADHGAFSVCNQSREDYYVNILWRSGLSMFSRNWTAKGPFHIPALSCEDLLSPFGEFANMHVGVKMKNTSGEFVEIHPGFKTSNKFGREVRATACTRDWKFERTGSVDFLDQCPSDFRPQNFRIYLDVPVIPFDQNYRNILTLY